MIVPENDAYEVKNLITDVITILDKYLNKDITEAGYTELCSCLTLVADAIQSNAIPQGYDMRTDALRSYYFEHKIDTASNYHNWEDIFEILSSFGEEYGGEEPNAFLFRGVNFLPS